jgi:hypothetical membrane protein
MAALFSNSKKHFQKSKLTQLSVYCGLLGPLVIGLGMLWSALGYTGTEGQAYMLGNHFVSELGQLGVSDLAVIFNASLILGGVLNSIFLTALALQLKGWLRYLMVPLGLGAALSGTLVGFFPMNNLQPHIFFALAFFNLGMLVSFVYSLLFLIGRGGPFPRWLALPGLFNTAAFLTFNNFPSQFAEGVDFQEGMQGLLSNRPEFIPLAALEWVVVLGILAWFLMIGLYLAFNRRTSGIIYVNHPNRQQDMD